MSSSTPPDEEANEETALLGNNSEASPLSITTTTTAPAEAERLLEEMDLPWPATFERSVSLLASPIINPQAALHFTKSPKPGNTPLAVRRYAGGPETPEGLLPPTRSNADFHKGVNKIQNLDFKATKESLKMSNLEDAQKTQEQKSKAAAAYRAKLLKEQKQQQPQKSATHAPEMSPGYRREKATDRHAKKQKADRKAASGVVQQQGSNKNVDNSKATVLQCVFNLSNILMGVGLLGLPFAFASAGWGGASFALLSFAFVTWKTSIMIGHELNGDPRPAAFFHDSPFKTPIIPGSDPKARMRRPIKSFPDIARVAFGQPGAIALSIVLYFELFSCLCIFLVAMGDHLHQLFPSISTTAHMTVVALLSMVPIVLLRTARLLSYLSMVGTLATIVVVITVFSASLIEGDITAEIAAKEGLEELEGVDHEYHDVWKPGGLPLACGLIAYCFSGHAIVPSIYSSMLNPPDFERVVHITYLVVLVSCFAVGMGGYYMFGNLVEDQVTLSLKENSSASGSMTLLAYLMVITAFSKLVLTMFPLALGMEEIIAPFLSSDAAVEVTSGVVKLSLTLLSLLVAVYVPSFSFLCALVGMICTMAVSIIFPAAAHLKLFGSKLSIWTKILDWTFVIVGTVMAVVGTALSVG